MNRLMLILALVLAVLAASAPVVLAAPDGSSSAATLPDIEDEVMCTVCGVPLQLTDAPQAERERQFINDLIAEGRSKDEIKDALVGEYGSGVLAVPGAEGFDLAAWLIPIGGVVAVLAAIGLAARRWRRTGAAHEDAETAESIDPADDERLRADLGRYQV